MIFQIKSWLNGGVLFSLETDSLKLCLEAAVKSGAVLSGADLRDADLRDADLRDAVLSGADLRGADLRGADLRDAVLSGAVLRGAVLRDADLRGADLRDAVLSGAVLRGADLRDADLRDAKGLDKFPIQIFGHKHFIQTTQDGNLRIGCEEHSFDEWRELAEELGGENGYSALDVEIYKLHIEHVERISKLLWNAKKEASA